MLIVCSVWKGERIHTLVTNKSYQISFTRFLCLGVGLKTREDKRLASRLKISCKNTQHKKRMRHCLPLTAARPQCLMPRSHNSKSLGSSSIYRTKSPPPPYLGGRGGVGGGGRGG